MTDALFEVDDFEETRADWTPIHHPGIESMGWHVEPGRHLPQHADGTSITKAEWSRYLATYRCRDCGGPVKHDRGGSEGGGYSLCHECGVIEDVTALWGGPHYNHTGMTIDDLHARQARRRADYLQKEA